MSLPSIVWDWNGTLLNDVDLSVSSINVLLKQRSLPVLTKNRYLDIFTFPVRDYYEAAGFDFTTEEFEVPAIEYINIYESRVNDCSLHEDAPEVLKFFKEKGYRQFVLSAMHQEMLEKTLEHNGILHFFEGVAGLDNHFAVSKAECGAQLFSRANINSGKTWMIGDTIHDSEVAVELGIRCVLVAGGHQSENRLRSTGTFVVSRLKELKTFQF